MGLGPPSNVDRRHLVKRRNCGGAFRPPHDAASLLRGRNAPGRLSLDRGQEHLSNEKAERPLTSKKWGGGSREASENAIDRSGYGTRTSSATLKPRLDVAGRGPGCRLWLIGRSPGTSDSDHYKHSCRNIHEPQEHRGCLPKLDERLTRSAEARSHENPDPEQDASGAGGGENAEPKRGSSRTRCRPSPQRDDQTSYPNGC